MAQALKFVRGERVETPVLIGDKAEWSLCAWVWAERAARTLYYERDGRKTTVANLVQLDAEGVLYLDGEAGASLTFEAWQFVCITKNATNVGFFVSGVRAASAAPMAVEAEMDKGLIGTNWTGVVDDLWVFAYNMLDYEVMTMYSTEGKAQGTPRRVPAPPKLFLLPRLLLAPLPHRSAARARACM